MIIWHLLRTTYQWLYRTFCLVFQHINTFFHYPFSRPHTASHRFYYPAASPDLSNNALTTINVNYANQKKPDWVVREVIYLKAIHPALGCRHIAHLFNRRFAVSKRMTVSKSYVYSKLIQHRYDIQKLKRKLKHKRPKTIPINRCWGIDLTTITDQNKHSHTIFAMIDYGSRYCLCLQYITNKSSLNLLYQLWSTCKQHGRPNAIKTDNETCFTSLTFKIGLTLLGIKHQRSEVACPWQNGRIERFIGTFKSKIRQVVIQNVTQLNQEIKEFTYYYNRIRPHDYLDGKTPYEVWHNINVFSQAPRKIVPYSAWNGVLTGELLLY
ncbi:transposase [Marinomonas agarivorans]|nr:transposase [Marinomonas agarivorans]